jgi:MFS family permease
VISPFAKLRRAFDDLTVGVAEGPFRALRHADFRRFLTGQGISLVGTWMQSIAQGWLVLELTGSAFAVGLAATLATLPVLFLTLYGGVVADRVDRRRFIMFLQSMMLVEAAVMAGLTLTHHITVEWIWGLAVVFGIATAFEVPTRQAFLVELVPHDDLISAAAINSTTYNLARVIGPAIAGIVVAAAGAGAAFAVNAASYVAVLIGLARIQKVHVPRPAVEGPSIFTGARYIAARPTLRGMTILMMLLTVFAGSFIPMLPVYAREVLKTGASGYGALTSAVGVGAVFGAIMIGATGHRFRRGRVTYLAASTLASLVIGLALVQNFAVAIALLACAGAAMACQGIVTATGLQLAATSDLRGRVMAVYSFVVLGLAPIGAFEAGWIAEHFGVAWSIGLNGAVCLIGTAFVRQSLWHGEEV